MRFRKLFVVAVCLGGLGAIAFFLDSRPQRVLAAGDAFPKASAVDIDGKAVPWPTGPFFVIYTHHDSEMGVQLEKYLRIQQQRQTQMLPVVTVVPGSDKEVRNLLRDTGTPSIVVPDRGAWRRRLGLGSTAFKLLLVDRSSNVTFAADYANPEDLRQLNDKTLSGRIQYPTIDNSTTLRVGTRFTGFSVVDVRTGEHTSFDSPAGATVVCFTSHCPECDLESEIGRYAAKQMDAFDQRTVTLLFSGRFSRADLARTASFYGIKNQLLQAVENIPGLEDPLTLETFSKSEIVKIDLGPDGVVENVSYWSPRGAGVL
jgi:hypothetical protein